MMEIDFHKTKFSFLDLETTGMSSDNERIIEIGVVKVENGKIIDKYERLINPNKSINYFIEQLTGIRQEDLLLSPLLNDVIKEFDDFISNTVVVAHNASFDLSFLRSEFTRHNMNFIIPYICSVKVARHLFPEMNSHGLSSIIEKFNFECKRRHRALDDAEVIYKFFQKSIETHSIDKLNHSLNSHFVA